MAERWLGRCGSSVAARPRGAIGLEEVPCGLAPLARRGRCVVSVGLNQPQIVKSNQPIPVDRSQPIAPDGVDAPAIELRYVTASLAVRRVVWSLGVGPRPRRYQARARGSSALASRARRPCRTPCPTRRAGCRRPRGTRPSRLARRCWRVSGYLVPPSRGACRPRQR